jgi:hypothetical protein
VSCDANGAFVGSIPLLKRSNAHGNDRWEPRDIANLSTQLSSSFGVPVDMASKLGGLRAICNALNEGNVARAQIATVLLGIPDTPALAKDVRSRDATIKFFRKLHWSGLIALNDDRVSVHPPSAIESDDPTLPRPEAALTKAGYNPNEPRGYHARWTNDGSGSAAPTGSQVVKPARRSSATARSQANVSNNEREGSSQSFGSHLWNEAETALSEIGQAQITESNANLAAANAETRAVAGWLGDLANYTAKPWIGPDGQPVQIPIINTGDPNADQGALIAHAILEPNAPLTRPGTNADWMAALIDLASIGTMAARPAVRPAGAEPVLSAEMHAPAVNRPFITLRARLPADFDTSQPIGKFEVPENLIPGTKGFGDYAHDRVGTLLQEAAGRDIKLTLNTAPYARGVDIKVPGDFIDNIGFEYAEIKPLSRTGRSRFNNQVLNIWDLEGRVQAITYDRNGNIYYGFPGYDEP